MTLMDFGGADPRQWRELLNHANAGELTLDPDVGGELVKECDDYLRKLDVVFERAEDVTRVDGFGTFPSSNALRDKFQEKADGTPQSLKAVIREHIDTVNLIKQTVVKSIANLTETDQNTGQRIGDVGQDIP